MPLLAALIGTALAVGGCVAGGPRREATPGEIQLTASWLDAEHLAVHAKNIGGSPVSLAGADVMRLTGPNGALPFHWNGMGPTLAQGEERSFEIHAMHMADGTVGMTMDHAMTGHHMAMPMGDYTLYVAGTSVTATLAP